MTPRQSAGSMLAFNLPGSQPTLVKNTVLNLNSLLDYDPFLNWMKKMINSGNSEALSLPIKGGQSKW